MRLVTTYLRIAPTTRGYKVQSSARPSNEPLRVGYDSLPTIQIKLKLRLPDDAWNFAIAEAVVEPAQMRPIVEVVS